MRASGLIGVLPCKARHMRVQRLPAQQFAQQWIYMHIKLFHNGNHDSHKHTATNIQQDLSVTCQANMQPSGWIVRQLYMTTSPPHHIGTTARSSSRMPPLRTHLELVVVGAQLPNRTKLSAVPEAARDDGLA